MNTNEMRIKAAEAVSGTIQRGMSMIMQFEGQAAGIPESIHLGCNTALAALTPIVPLLVQRPNLTEEEIRKNGPNIIKDLINPDTILLAALITARMHVGTQIDEETTDMSKNGGQVGLAQEVEFGPGVFKQALDDWSKLTSKDPRSVFDPRLLDGLEETLRKADVPFEEFLEKRLKDNPFRSSKTLQ